jgi:hypothetical protein
MTDSLAEMIKYYQNKDEHELHLKGYIYDSLVYRYQLALYKASLKDAQDIMIKKGISLKEAEVEAKRNYDRNLLRFCEILNEAIGEHD